MKRRNTIIGTILVELLSREQSLEANFMQTIIQPQCIDGISRHPEARNSFATTTRRMLCSNPACTFLIALLCLMLASRSARAFDNQAALSGATSLIASGTAGFSPAPVSKLSFAGVGQGAVATATIAAPIILAPIITVAPAVDLPGRPRVITISGQTYAGCPFMTPVVDAAASQLLGGVVIRLDPVPTLAPCSTIALAPYRFEIPYTPVAIGTLRVVAASSSGLIRSESRIATAGVAGRARAVGDISGLWYDPASNGSGLQFTHNPSGSDGVFGTWFLYDLDGKPRWLTIQGVVWRDDGSVFTADLFENRASIIGCSPACLFDGLIPRTAPTITKIGTVRVSFTGLGPYSDTPPQGIAEVFSLTGVSIFKSIILRIPL